MGENIPEDRSEIFQVGKDYINAIPSHSGSLSTSNGNAFEMFYQHDVTPLSHAIFGGFPHMAGES